MILPELRKMLSWTGALLAIALQAAPAHAALEIRNLPTKNVSCSAGVCTATRPYAVMNAGDLASMLAASDVTLRSGSLASDVEVKAPLSWASASRLTLDSYHSIVFYKPLTVAGTGALTMTTDDGGQYGSVLFFEPGSVKFWDASSNLIIDGQPYTLASSISQLAQEIAANPNGNYALANDYNAKPDGVYTQSPIPTVFNGTFQGLGHTISNLTIDVISPNGSGIGLFAGGGLATYASVHLANARVSAAGVDPNGVIVGGLVGNDQGHIFRVTVSGAISASAADNNTFYVAGGIAGTAKTQTSIYYSVSSASVSGSGGGTIGGLVGLEEHGAIVHSVATGRISGDPNHRTDVGGLIGALDVHGGVKFSYATGRVSGTGSVGGLIGEIYSFGGGEIQISNSHASGNISGSGDNDAMGGLVGSSWEASFLDSYASGSVTGAGSNSNVGGLVGLSDSDLIRQSFATGAITGGTCGGLVGSTSSSAVENSYATGAVGVGGHCKFAGGLAGYSSWTIGASYSTGTVAGATAGGLMGDDGSSYPRLSFDYWDLDTSGIGDPSRGAGNIVNDPGITGLTDAQLKSGLPAGFDPSIWAENPSINSGLPYLLANPPP
jgi:hypothetical protein